MRTLLCLLLLLALFFVPVSAEEYSVDVSAVEEGLTEEAREVSGNLVTDGSYELQGAFERLIVKAKEELIGQIRGSLADLTRIAAIAVACALTKSLCADGRISEIVSVCACAAVVLNTASAFDSLAGEMTETVRSLCDYARVSLPAVYTAAAVSGAVVSSGARYAAVMLCLNVLMDVLSRVMIPLIYANMALCISRSVFPNPVLGAVISAVKWGCVTALTALAMGIGAYIGLTGALTGGADALAVKGTKTVIASALPVVGGILSDAASVVLAGASMIKNAAGTFALVGVCAMCLGPFAAIGIKMLLFRLCAAIASAVENGRLSVLLRDLSASLGMMLGVLGTVTIMLFLSFAAAIRTVSG